MYTDVHTVQGKFIILGTENCSHHWILEDNTNRISKGVCIKCGEERLYDNVFEFDKEPNERKTRAYPIVLKGYRKRSSPWPHPWDG